MRYFILYLTFFAVTPISNAQDGDLDLPFNPGPGPEAAPLAIVPLPDGDVLIGGGFANVHGYPINGIARLNSDGSKDPAFDPGSGIGNGAVQAIAVQPDGRILIGGHFNTVSDQPSVGLARLMSGGELDGTFVVGTGIGGSPLPVVRAFAILPDGRVLLGGQFQSYDGNVCGHLVRLMNDGTFDPSFNGVVNGSNGQVNAIALQGDGKLIIAGLFSSFNGTACSNILRLNIDGSIDDDFNVGTATIGGLSELLLLPDGDIMVAGDFLSFNGVITHKLVRLNGDGSVDFGFISNPGPGGLDVFSIARCPNGDLIAGGEFNSYDGVTYNRIVRLQEDGTADPLFSNGIGTGLNDIAYTVAVDAAGGILIGGEFNVCEGQQRQSLTRLNGDGTLDNSFNFRNTTSIGSSLRTLALQSDGKILVGGSFTTYNGVAVNNVVRLLSDGSIDPSFDSGEGPDNWVYSIDVQSDGRILLAGNFNDCDLHISKRVARLMPDGSVDLTFTSGLNSSEGTAYVVKEMSDGRIMVGGTYGHNLDRLLSDGTIDPSFGPVQVVGLVSDLEVTSDGGCVLVGGFTALDIHPAPGIAKLIEEGTMVSSFDPGSGFDDFVNVLESQANSNTVGEQDKWLVGGQFNAYNGLPRSKLLRILANGDIDPTFEVGMISGNVSALLHQPDGRIIIGGEFYSVDGVTRGRIARLLPNGSLDTSFDPGTGALGGDGVRDIKRSSSGTIVAAGRWEFYDDIRRRNIVSVSSAIVTAIPEGNIVRLDAHPNPFVSQSTITFPFNGEVHLTVHDMEGRIVLDERRNSHGTETIDLSNNAPGVYQLRIEANGVLAHAPLIKVQ